MMDTLAFAVEQCECGHIRDAHIDGSGRCQGRKEADDSQCDCINFEKKDA